jgi:exopolysaccharide biosynthesis WecB/TagA/CpsF family protein
VAYPGLRISFVGEEWEKGEWIPREFQENVAGYEDIKKIEKNMLTPRLHLPAEQEIGILFVAYGFPKQEQWITDHIDSLPFRVGMGVGGAFDYFSGTVSRAPKLIQRIGFEWLYRLARQPWRVKRQVALLDFIRLAIAERSLHSS